jgi:hypothetical protein
MALYVGRGLAIEQLKATLKGDERLGGKLCVQAIHGPGGIGKTALFDHVLGTVDLSSRRFLVMRVSGNLGDRKDVFQLTRALLASATARVPMVSQVRYQFSYTEEVQSAYEAIMLEAEEVLRRELPGLPVETAMAALRTVVDIGKGLTEMFPAAGRVVDLEQIKTRLPEIESVLKRAGPFLEEIPGFLEKLGLRKGVAFRNSIRRNPLDVLAEALVSDLSALLSGYQRKDRFKPSKAKINGVDRLLLIVDDYEALYPIAGEFLVKHLVARLKSCDFESVLVILGRDALALTHPGWQQHHHAALAPTIPLAPLSRAEMDLLVQSKGQVEQDQLDRAWRDTLGYPLLVNLWLEEANEAQGLPGPTVGMLKRFHDRTTHWLDEQQREWLYAAVFMPVINIETFGQMLSDPAEGRRAFLWFETDASIRDPDGRAYNVREFVRSRIVDYLEATDPGLCRSHRTRAANLVAVVQQSD